MQRSLCSLLLSFFLNSNMYIEKLVNLKAWPIGLSECIGHELSFDVKKRKATATRSSFYAPFQY